MTTSRKPKVYPVPTEPGHYWVRLFDPKTLDGRPFVDNDRVVRITMREGRLEVDAKSHGVIGRHPANFDCYAWGPRVAVPKF
jgi:hypothetical protein